MSSPMFEMDADPPLPSSPQDIPTHHQTTCYIIEGILERCTQVEMELHERVMEHLREIGEERKRSSLKRRLVVRLRKDGYDASLCMSSWVATTEHPGGVYEYIDVHVAGELGDGPGSSATAKLIVDVDFGSQFQLARPAPWYAHLTRRLPAVFVGPEERLRRAVALLCTAVQRSLRESGLHVPPWRRSSYMQAKWLPCHAAPTGGDVGARAVAQWSVAREMAAGPRRSGSGRLLLELAAQDEATWTMM